MPKLKLLPSCLTLCLSFLLSSVFNLPPAFANIDYICPPANCKDWQSCNCSFGPWQNGTRTCSGKQECSIKIINNWRNGWGCRFLPRSCQISETDNVPPQVLTTKQVLAAHNSVNGEIIFQDSISGISRAEIEIENAQGQKQTYAATNTNPHPSNQLIIPFQNHDFSTARSYDLVYTARDAAGNSVAKVTISDFFKVLANIPDTQKTVISSSPQTAKVADGTAQHFVEVQLRDRYNNPVIPIPGLKKVTAQFNFADQTALNQLAGNRVSSARFRAPEFDLDCDGKTYGNPTLCNNQLSEDGSDGNYRINVSSFAPTSTGYEPISDKDFTLKFTDLNFKVKRLAGQNFGDYTVNSVGAADGTLNAQNSALDFQFKPALETSLEATNYTGREFTPESEISNNEPAALANITVEANKRFLSKFINQSPSHEISELQAGYQFNTGIADVTWQAARLEKIGSQHLTNLRNLTLMTTAMTTAPIFNNLSNVLNSISTQQQIAVLLRAIPKLVAQKTTARDLVSKFQTYVKYQIQDKTVAHKSQPIAKQSQFAFGLYNPQLQTSGVSNKIGDISLNEFKTATDKKIAYFLNSGVQGCQINTLTTITNLENFVQNNPDCLYNNEVIFFSGTDVTLDLEQRLPAKRYTILLHGGNLSLKSNLLRKEQTANILGLIISANQNSGGNIFLFPEVTKIEAALYTKGSLISVNRHGRPTEDLDSNCTGSKGFCDRSFELHNQLYLKGLLVSRNTNDGANQTPPECPANNLIQTCTEEAAIIFDLVRLRTYHPRSGGTKIHPTLEEAVIIEYDSRVKTHTPPLFAN